ncbi:cytochrome c oxidase subunit 2A [Bacillus shivajii]|nr:cytochrome c oxidase subunit 2A [Bacillus shivajii]UCZ53676.1 cytochrome c oxidase subunit 2A [Bacillus shivajii]
MSKPMRDHQPKQTSQENSSLKGTLVFVMSIGGFILVSWFAVFFLFLGRI